MIILNLKEGIPVEFFSGDGAQRLLGEMAQKVLVPLDKNSVIKGSVTSYFFDFSTRFRGCYWRRKSEDFPPTQIS
jgi:hypothetical protein